MNKCVNNNDCSIDADCSPQYNKPNILNTIPHYVAVYATLILPRHTAMLLIKQMLAAIFAPLLKVEIVVIVKWPKMEAYFIQENEYF